MGSSGAPGSGRSPRRADTAAAADTESETLPVALSLTWRSRHQCREQQGLARWERLAHTPAEGPMCSAITPPGHAQRTDRAYPPPTSTDDYLVERRIGIAVQKRLNLLSQSSLNGARVHGHEGLETLVFDDRYVVAALTRLEQPPADETFERGVGVVRSGEPRPELVILALPDRRECHDVHQHPK